MDKKLENKFYDLLSAKLSGDASPEELTQLYTFLRQNPQFQFLYDEIIRPVQVTADIEHHTQQAYAAHSVKVMYAGDAENTEKASYKLGSAKISRLVYALVAAASLLAAVVGIIWFLNNKEKQDSNTLAALNSSKNEVVTPKGSKSSLTLPDGTKVTLNADSKLNYSEDFAKGKREVVLAGEAYFDVKHNAEHPFIIHTADITVKVLGTAFNVRAYPDEANTETALIRGSLQVTLNKDENQKIFLKPNQKISVRNEKVAARQKETPLIAVTEITKVDKTDSSVIETQWLNNKLVFDREPLENIVVTLERWYGVQVKVNNKSLLSEKFSGVFENKTIEEVLGALQMVGLFNYVRKDDIIIIN